MITKRKNKLLSSKELAQAAFQIIKENNVGPDIAVNALNATLEKKYGITIPSNLKRNTLARLTKMKNIFINEKCKNKKLKKMSKINKKRLKEQILTNQPKQIADFQLTPQKPISLDQIIDRYIIRYERESIPLDNKPYGPGIAPLPGSQPAGGVAATLEESNFINLNKLLKFLIEQEETDNIENTPANPDISGMFGNAESGAEDMSIENEMIKDDDAEISSNEATKSDEPIINTPQINLNEFARSIARLINNYDALLNPRTIILNRVEAYLARNYNDLTAKHFIQIMENNYNLNVTNVEYPEYSNTFPVIYGVGAYPGGVTGG